MENRKNTAQKIAMLLEGEFPPDLRVAMEAETLAASGFQVAIFCLTFSDQPRREQYQPNIVIYRKRISKKVFNKLHTTILWTPFYADWWARFILSTDQRFHFIHVHDLPLCRVGRKIAREMGARLIVDFHENYPAALKIWEYSSSFGGRLLYPPEKWRQYELETVSRADRIILVTEEALDRFRAKGIPAEKFAIVSNVPLLQKLQQIERKITNSHRNQGLEIIYVGGFGIHRGLETLISATALLQKKFPQIHVTLVGSGRGADKLKRMVNEMKLDSRITFTGWLPFEDAMIRLSQADIAVLPPIKTEHTDTTVPHKLFQYMYFEKPVVVSDCRPLARIIAETNAGLVFSAGDASDLADKLSYLIGHEAERKKMGRNGKQAVLTTYNWDIEGRKLLDVYHGTF